MRTFISVLIVFASTGLLAQNFCYTTEMQNEWFKKHPGLKAGFDKQLKDAADLDKELYKTGYHTGSQNKSTASITYTIPIVFHILHVGGNENISDAQVIDAVNILTRDYNKLNPDTSNVVIQFKNIIGNVHFEFRLATKDPNGNCTNGIIRHWDPNTNWAGDLGGYAYTWPPNRYLNIYVVRTMGGGAAGYTFLPGTGVPPAMDAVVVLSSYVGSIGTSNVGLSRVLTHEVGHWFNLEHVWGGSNNPGVACGDDGVTDTPITMGYSFCNLNNAAVCTPGVVENVQNYMEYAYCDRMFTIGQATRMQTAINSNINSRNNLSTLGNLAFTGVTSPGANCIPYLSVGAFPSATICSGRSLSLNSFTYNAVPTGYSWSATNEATILSPASATTSVTFNNPGTTSISCVVSNANGSSTAGIVVTVENGVTEISSSNPESFENSSVLPPLYWSVINPTSPNEKWEIFTFGGSEGANCMYVPGENLTANSIEILQSPSYDFKNNPGAIFTFKCAYAKQKPNQKDVFKVQASKDCGGNWADILVPNMTSLANSSGGVEPNIFYPIPNQWVFKDVSAITNPAFLQFNNEENVVFRFYFEEDVDGSGLGNRFYLDEVNFTTPTGINQLTRSIDFNVYPNPTSSAVILSFNLSDPAKIKYKVVSISGSVLLEENEKPVSRGYHEIKINENNKLAPGIYFLNFELDGIKMSKKLIVN